MVDTKEPSGPAESRHALERRILDGLGGSVPARGSSPAYLANIGLLAFASALLPVVYVGVMAGVAFLVYLHATWSATWLLHGRSGPRISWVALLLYLTPIAAGAFVLVLLLKPLLARSKPEPAGGALDAASEPFIYAFVDRLCALLGAPKPRLIRVEMTANAAASMEAPERALGARRLTITIGAILLQSLSLRQLAGVLAHETGHLSQRLARFAQQFVRNVNAWLVRVVFERDAWDEFLEEHCEFNGCSVSVLFLFCRGAVGLVRKFFHGLLVASHALVASMGRQMEWDSDRCEVLVAGSGAFESTFQRMRLLQASSWAAHRIFAEGEWKKLPDNLPAFVAWLADRCPGAVRARIEKEANQQVARWWEPHPADRDRVEAARKLAAAGIVAPDLPATALLRDPERVFREATAAHFREELGGGFRGDAIVPHAQLEKSREEHVDTQLRTWRWFHGCADSRRPWPVMDRFVTIPEGRVEARAGLEEARVRVLHEAASWHSRVEEREKLEDRILSGTRCAAILDALSRRQVDRFDAREFEEARSSGLAAERERVAVDARLDDLERPMAARIAMALAFVDLEWLDLPDRPGLQAAAGRLRKGFRFLNESFQPVADLICGWAGIDAYLTVKEHAGLGQVGSGILAGLVDAARKTLLAMQPMVAAAAEAFEAQDPSSGVANLLPLQILERAEIPQLQAMSRVLVQRRFDLFLWSIDETARLGEAVEDALGLPRLPEPPEDARPWA
ncbi:MAG: M48 family metalloprotease [Planctomycetes bacterium]|nr:M48 family metalloprotease [Planctomycetota bacterium]